MPKFKKSDGYIMKHKKSTFPFKQDVQFVAGAPITAEQAYEAVIREDINAEGTENIDEILKLEEESPVANYKKGYYGA